MHARNKALDTLRIRCFAGKGILVRGGGGGGGQQLAPGECEMQSERQSGWRAIAKWCYLRGERRPLDAVCASQNPPAPGIANFSCDIRRPSPLHTNANRASLESEIRSFGPQKPNTAICQKKIMDFCYFSEIFWLFLIYALMLTEKTKSRRTIKLQP